MITEAEWQAARRAAQRKERKVLTLIAVPVIALFISFGYAVYHFMVH